MLLLLLFFFEWFVFLLLDCVCRLVVNCRRLRKSTDDESKGRAGRRKRGRPHRRSMVIVREDMQRIGVTKEDAGRTWRQMIGRGDP